MVKIPQEDHSWMSDYVHASNGWRDSGSAAGVIGRQVRENRIATQKFVNQPTKGKQATRQTHVQPTARPVGGTVAHSGGWLETLTVGLGVLVGLAAAMAAAWFSFNEMPEIVALDLWKRIPAALGMGLVAGGLAFGLLVWLFEFVIDVLLPLLFRLAIFAAMMGGLYLAAQNLL